MNRVRSFGLKKKNSVRRDNPLGETEDPSLEVAVPQDKLPASNSSVDTSQAKWSRNTELIEKMLGSAKKDLSPEQMDTLNATLLGADGGAQQTKKEPSSDSKSSSRSRNKSRTHTSAAKSTRFLKLPTKNNRAIAAAAEAEKAYFQQIDLRAIEICQQIGCGASSAGVYLCLVDGWACAMKQLRREHVGAIDIKCFEREMDILYQLPPHPSIVRYLFHTSLGSDLCLFMQLYSGTLREYLDERRKTNNYLTPEKISQIALMSAQGIQFLHQHKVIHRDIKAGNVFITKSERGDITRIAIGDFDTSLRVSASLRNVKKEAEDDIISHESVSDPTMFRPHNRRDLNTTEKRNLFAQARPRSTVGECSNGFFEYTDKAWGARNDWLHGSRGPSVTRVHSVRV